MGAMSRPFWEEKPLEKMTRSEWESLCDGCGKCCLHKLEDEDSGELLPTNVACRMLDRRTGYCSDYRNRRIHVPECVRLTPRLAREIEWLPGTCAYRLLAAGEMLPDWHPLITGDPDSTRKAGQSVSGWTVSEDEAGDLEYHLIDRDL
jgi:uncharacterized cysteine cluster protein YcgN (CxxCxxCC family)